MLSKIVCRRFDLVDDARTSSIRLPLCLTDMVDVVLMLESSGPVLLVFEYFSQNTFGLSWVGISVVLDWHASTMNSVELTLYVLASWWSLTARVGIALRHWWSTNIDSVVNLSLNQWSDLIAAWLNHQTTISCSWICWSINRLPSIFMSRSSVPTGFSSLASLFTHKSDW